MTLFANSSMIRINMPNQLALKLPGTSIGTSPTKAVEIPTPPGFKGEFQNLSSIMTQALPLLFSIAGLLLLLYLLWGGFNYLTSMGDPKKAAAGRQKITYAVLGFFIIFISFWLVQIIDYVFKLGVYNPIPTAATP